VIRNSPPFCEVSDGPDTVVGHSVESSRPFRTGKLRFCISALTLCGFVFGVNGTRLAALGRLSNGYREKEMRESRIVSISQAVDGLRETFHSLMPSASSSLCVFLLSRAGVIVFLCLLLEPVGRENTLFNCVRCLSYVKSF
jgi:hypothetical protein